MFACGVTQRFGGMGTERMIDQHGVPGALGQQGQGDVDVRDHAGLRAPALQSAGRQRRLDALRRHQHDRLAAQVGGREFARLAFGRRDQRDRNLERRAGTGLALQRDAAAHALDDALGDAQPQAGAAIVARDAFVGLFELAEDPLARLGRDADAGVAHQEADFIRPDAGLDDQRDAAGDVNLIALPARLSSTWRNRAASPITSSGSRSST